MISFVFQKSNTLQKRFVRLFGLAILAMLFCGSSAMAQEPVFDAEFKVKTDTRLGMLSLNFTVPDGWHCFSTTQVPGGPTKSKITVKAEGVKVIGDFVPLEPAVAHKSEIFEIVVEEHEGFVTWQAPIEFDAGADPESVELTVKYDGQICNNDGTACKPVNEKLTATFVGFEKALAVPEQKTAKAIELLAPAKDHASDKKKGTPKKLTLDAYRPKSLHVELSGSIWTDDGKQNFKPGDEVTLEITAVPVDEYHFYAYEIIDPMSPSPTLISFETPEGWQVLEPAVSVEPVDHDGALEHSEPTTWSFKVKIPADAASDQVVSITGGIFMLTCNDQGCDRPTDTQFAVKIPMGTDSAAALEFSKGKSGAVKKAIKAGNYAGNMKGKAAAEKPAGEAVPATEQKTGGSGHAGVKFGEHNVRPDTPEEIAVMARLYQVDDKIKYLDAADMEANPIGSGGTSDRKQTSLARALLFAFLGGALLNLMPCVFPVLGIKVMGFVKQGGENAAKVRMHGLAFAAGLVVSMWVLAGALLILKYNFTQNIIWGEQMANPYFVGGIIVLLFMLGLNMAGVFEVGTSLSSVGGQASNKEGYSGSFFSGVLTTLIATPCSGPFLGTAMTYALSQSGVISMLMFTVFGLGIALPYVLLSFFPPLIKRLPKPGPWMETFKVTMAFALFATVAFFMQTFGAQTGVEGVNYMLMGLVVIGLAAYFYGSFGEGHIAAGKRWAFGYLMPCLIAAAGCWLVFSASSRLVVADDVVSEVSDGPIPWVTWNPGKVKDSLKKQQIVWVDYTADW